MAQALSRAEKAALGLLSQGSYDLNPFDLTGQTWNANVETSSGALAGTYASDVVVTWLRAQLWIYSASGIAKTTAMVIRLNSGESAPDLSDASVVERLRNEGRIFWVGRFIQGYPGGGTRIQPIKLEFYNIKLAFGQALMLYHWRPSNVTDGVAWGVVETRTMKAAGGA